MVFCCSGPDSSLSQGEPPWGQLLSLLCCAGTGSTLGSLWSLWQDPALVWEQNLVPLYPTKTTPTPARLCHAPPAAKPTNYLLMKSWCTWGTTEPGSSPSSPQARGEQLCQPGESFGPGVSRPFRGWESPWPRGWLWAHARPQEPPGCGQGRANLGLGSPGEPRAAPWAMAVPCWGTEDKPSSACWG